MQPPEGPDRHAGERIGRDRRRHTGTDVWLVRYDPNIVEAPVARGENSGRTLPHTHVVHALERLGSWSGTAQTYALSASPAGMKTAVLLQVRHGGVLLGAATN